jgi:murein DD-endopeptidase MepM/ murein hydrolase activator NlpD
MISPYNGTFRVSQEFSNPNHTGLDLVGVDSKTVYSTVDGVVEYSGWEGANPHTGFGLYVIIKDDNNGWYYYYGHLSETFVRTGQRVSVKQKIGIEGDTGYSFGSHLHYEIRKNRGVEHKGSVDVTNISGIPNEIGTYNDGYVKSEQTLPRDMTVSVNPGYSLNVRTGPGTNYPLAKFPADTVIDGIRYRAGQEVKYPRGTVVTVYDISNGWAKGVRGYMSAEFLK